MASDELRGTPVKTIFNAGAYGLYFPKFGNIVYRIVIPDEDGFVFGVWGGDPARKQEMNVILQQPKGGGAEVFPPDNIRWQEGHPPFIDSRPAAITVLTFTSFSGNNNLLFGRVGF